MRKLPADIRDELAFGSLLLGVARAKWRWPVSTLTYCSDATKSSTAVVSATVSRDLAFKMYQGCEYQGKHIPFGASTMFDLGDSGIPNNQVCEEIVRCKQWHLCDVQFFRDEIHVTYRELGAVCQCLRLRTTETLNPERIISGEDSSASIGAQGKGRSPSFKANSILRRHIGWGTLGNKSLSCFKVGTEDNPSDDPTRLREVRIADEPPDSLKTLLKAQRPDVFYGDGRRFLGGACRECFAGGGGLSRAWARKGLWVEPPFECCPASGRYIRGRDLDVSENRLRLEWEVRCGYLRYMHFALVCSTWGRAGVLNGGTRSRLSPDGSSSPLLRETHANKQAAYVVRLCMLLHVCGGFFTIENPESSFLWASSFILSIYDFCPTFCAVFSQCLYNIVLPSAPPDTYCKKDTKVLANFADITALSRKCTGPSLHHHHEWAWGARKHKGRSICLAAAAGRYPRPLCEAWSEVIVNLLQKAA